MVLEILNMDQYKTYQQCYSKWNNKEQRIFDKIIPLLIFGFMGALAWAIRGTAGFGGMSGAIVAGLMIGSVFYYLAYMRGIDGRFQMFALGLGLGIGGINGYGQFVNWIMGKFYINMTPETLPINPAIGFLWLFILGLEWGGISGIIIGWTSSNKKTVKQWMFRIATPIISYILGSYFVIWNKSWIFPYYSDDLYLGGTCTKNCPENDTILPIIGGLVLVFISMCIVEKLLKNSNSIKYGLIIGLFFGGSFAISSVWLYLYIYIPGFDWWKAWEESIGFFGGLGIGLVFLKVINVDENVQKSTDSNIKWNKYLISIVSLIIVSFLLIGGMSKSFGLIFKFDLEDYGDDILKSPTRIFFYSLTLIGCQFFMISKYRIGKKKEKTHEDLFFVKNISSKMILLISFFSLMGMIATNSIRLMIMYFLLYWMILILLLLLQNKIPIIQKTEDATNIS